MRSAQRSNEAWRERTRQISWFRSKRGLCLNPSFQTHASTGTGTASSGQRHRGNMRDFTVEEREEMRRLEAKLLESIGQPPPERLLVAETVAISPHVEKAQNRKVPQVGLFFLLKGKLLVDGLPWTEVPNVARFRTYCVGHPEYWRRLKEDGAVPKDMSCEECPRGRVNYDKASGRFTLFADRCIIKDYRLVSAIMNEFNLPMGTRALADDLYRCPDCLPK